MILAHVEMYPNIEGKLTIFGLVRKTMVWLRSGILSGGNRQHG